MNDVELPLYALAQLSNKNCALANLSKAYSVANSA